MKKLQFNQVLMMIGKIDKNMPIDICYYENGKERFKRGLRYGEPELLPFGYVYVISYHIHYHMISGASALIRLDKGV